MATRCPHKCSRCRAIEAGYGNKPLSALEFGRVHELITPERNDPEWSPETVEAALAVDVAESAFDGAERTLAQVCTELHRAKNSGGDLRVAVDYGPLLIARPNAEEVRELQETLRVAKAEYDEAGERLQEARGRHSELTRLDAARHREAEYQADQVEAERERAKGVKEQRRAARSVIRRLADAGKRPT